MLPTSASKLANCAYGRNAIMGESPIAKTAQPWRSCVETQPPRGLHEANGCRRTAQIGACTAEKPCSSRRAKPRSRR